MIVDVGVDGGQSQVRLAIVGRDGVTAADGVAHADGDTEALLVARVAEAWSRARRPSDELGRIVLGLTTMPADPAAAHRLAAAVARATGAREVGVCGDEVSAHAGAFPDRHGVVMVVGTGIACLAIDAGSGRVRRVDGDGYLLGDRGAAFWIGSRGLAAVLGWSDGRSGATTLAEPAGERFGPLPQLAARVHGLARPVDAVAQFGTVVQEHARAGDPIADAIVADAAGEIVASVLAGAAVLTARVAPVAITGRTVSEGSILRERVEGLIAREPALRLVAAAGSPLDGACGLAADGTPPAYDQLITTWRTT